MPLRRLELDPAAHRHMVRGLQKLVQHFDETQVEPLSGALAKEFARLTPVVERARAWLRSIGEPEHPAAGDEQEEVV